MVANPSKFQYMILGLGKDIDSISIENNTLTATKAISLLGITIDKDLRFDEHLEKLCKSANNKVKCLKRLRNMLDERQAKVLYNTFILSQFDYCQLIWMFSSKCSNKKIERTQKRALSVCLNIYDLPLNDLLALSNQHSIHERNIIFLLIEIYKTFNNQNPSFMKTLFNKKVTNYNLRTKNLLYGINSFSFRASLLWNLLPDETKYSSTLKRFKEKL